jgi:hypothetical protein
MEVLWAGASAIAGKVAHSRRGCEAPAGGGFSGPISSARPSEVGRSAFPCPATAPGDGTRPAVPPCTDLADSGNRFGAIPRRGWKGLRLGYIETILEPGEQITHHAYLHWIIYVRAVVLMLIGVLLLLYGIARGMEDSPAKIIGLFAFLLGVGDFLEAMIKRWTTEIAVTNQASRCAWSRHWSRSVRNSVFSSRIMASISRKAVNSALRTALVTSGVAWVRQGTEGYGERENPRQLCVLGRPPEPRAHPFSPDAGAVS